MDAEVLLGLLERVAERLEIPVSYATLATEELPGRGGLCVIRGERRIIIERSLTTREKVRLLAAGLGELELEGFFLPPAVREAIENISSSSRGSSDSSKRGRRSCDAGPSDPIAGKSQ